MPYRTFVDSVGGEWQVWDIVPQLRERRADGIPERRLKDVEIQFPNRRRDNRRLTVSRPAVLRGSYANGWLCFESHREKRRLTPIPVDWTACSDDRLEGYLRAADRVNGSGRVALDFNAEPPLAEAG